MYFVRECVYILVCDGSVSKYLFFLRVVEKIEKYSVIICSICSIFRSDFTHPGDFFY